MANLGGLFQSPKVDRFHSFLYHKPGERVSILVVILPTLSIRKKNRSPDSLRELTYWLGTVVVCRALTCSTQLVLYFKKYGM